MKLFSNSITSLEKGLDYAALRQKAITDNIANVDTPNYKAKDVNFREIMEEANDAFSAHRTDQRHFQFSSSNSSPTPVRNNFSYNENQNSVDLDSEMTKLASNQIYYNALIDRLGSKYSSLSNVIKGGR